MASRPKRIMAVASAGGHWVQLSRISPAFEGHDCQYVSTMKSMVAPSGNRQVLAVHDASRHEPFRLIALWLRLAWHVVKFRPNVLITTGAAPGLIALQISKMIGARTIWIDSIANAEQLSMSGQLARRFADDWMTQWPHVAEKYDGLKYAGRVL